MASFRKIFEGGDFAACRAAEAFLDKHGFSYGRLQRGSPRGILTGKFDIQKWRNLNAADRAALDGVITGDMLHGPVIVEIFNALHFPEGILQPHQIVEHRAPLSVSSPVGNLRVVGKLAPAPDNRANRATAQRRQCLATAERHEREALAVQDRIERTLKAGRAS